MAHGRVSDIRLSFVKVISFCTLLFVLPKARLISTAVSSKVWEGPRCRLSQGRQLGAVLTCSLIKSSWARVHLWQGLCQAADRWEAVLNTNVTPSADRQEMHHASPPPLTPPHSTPAVPTTAVIQYLIYDMTQAGGVQTACLLISFWVGVHPGLPWFASEKTHPDKAFCAADGDGNKDRKGWGGISQS